MLLIPTVEVDEPLPKLCWGGDTSETCRTLALQDWSWTLLHQSRTLML